MKISQGFKRMEPVRSTPLVMFLFEISRAFQQFDDRLRSRLVEGCLYAYNDRRYWRRAKMVRGIGLMFASLARFTGRIEATREPVYRESLYDTSGIRITIREP